MKLFDTFEAVKFPEENMIFITHSGYLYYIFNPENKTWRKHQNAGNDLLTVFNYPDISKEELINAMNGIFPQKETDFMRLCKPSQLHIRDMSDLLNEDYAEYMSDYEINSIIHRVLSESNILHKSFEGIQKTLKAAAENHYDNSRIAEQIKDFSFKIIGRDIFKNEIEIVDGHDDSSYFWIMPVRVIDYSDTNEIDNVAEMRSAEISIEEDDVAQYLVPFLDKHYDDKLEANRRRIEYIWTDNNGNEQTRAVCGFEWNLTHNFFTFNSIEQILNDIADTVDALISGRETEYTKKLKIKRGTAAYRLVYAKSLSDEALSEYNANRPTKDATEAALIVDFYKRFLCRMEYMMKVGRENGYDLISFMGP